MSLQSYREWKLTKEAFDMATTATQGRQALKTMNPRITAFASNLANVLAQVDNERPGYAKRLITSMMSKMEEPNPMLRNKLLQTVRYLPDAAEQPMNPNG